MLRSRNFHMSFTNERRNEVIEGTGHQPMDERDGYFFIWANEREC